MQLDFVSALVVFMLATFIGLDVIRRVSRLLHTPLMSLTNAISAIAVVGAIILAGEQASTLGTVLGSVAVFASMGVCKKMMRSRSSSEKISKARSPRGLLSTTIGTILFGNKTTN